MQIIQHIVGFSKKSQMKIQQMAFMLVAVMIFFAMIAVIYFSISLSRLESQAEEAKNAEARELARQLVGSPEFAFLSRSRDCSSCLDFEKAYQISQLPEYKKNFWNLDYLIIEVVYPNVSSQNSEEGECNPSNYPNCNIIKIIESETFSTKVAFVALARWDPSMNSNDGGWKYELGKIHTSAKQPPE